MINKIKTMLIFDLNTFFAKLKHYLLRLKEFHYVFRAKKEEID